MARAGMALRRGGNQGNTDNTGDDVQRSIELLDRVLSEFDDVENANQVQNIQQLATSTSTPQLRSADGTADQTPDLESPSLGHQSEDDGYMSMNGRKQKFTLSFRPLQEHHELTAAAVPTVPTAGLTSPVAAVRPGDPDDFPPPPEEAQRLIATLLPKVSPTHRPVTKPRSTNGSGSGGGGGRGHHRSFPLTQLPARMDTIPPPQRFQNECVVNVNVNVNAGVANGLLPDPIHTATQTTLPKTKHQRPYGWENNDFALNPPPPPPGYRYGSLPYQHGVYPITSPTRVPPRTVPTALERHREVKRHGSEDNLSSDLDDPATSLRPLSEMADDERFSDDSLEEMLPPPPPPQCEKRASIAWEVPLDEDALLTPGSTKVINRRRRKSGSYSSTSSIPNRLKEFDDWPDPPPCTTEDEVTSPFSDSDDHMMLPPELNSADISGNSTYIIRKGKNDRKALQNLASSLTSNSSLNSRLSSELSIPASRYSIDLNSRLSRELQTPNSRYSIDLSTPHSRLSQELNSPKSRFSLDLNNSRLVSQELSSSPSRLSTDLSSSRSSTPSKQPGETRKGEISSPVSPIVRVVSLPNSLESEDYPRRELGVTVEEEEDAESSQPSTEISPLRKIEQSISELLERRDIEVVQNEQFVLNGVESLNREKKDRKKAPSKPEREPRHRNDLQKSSSHNEIQKSEDYYRQLLLEGGMPFPKRNGIQKSESAKEMLIAHRDSRPPPPLPTSTSADFPVRVEVQQQQQRDFPPLPPSPVAEDDDEYAEIAHPAFKGRRADTLPNSNETPPVVPPHRGATAEGLKTRSMDVNYSRGRRGSSNNGNFLTSSTRATASERRMLPSNDQPPRRAYQKRSSSQSQHSPLEEERLLLHQLQTSCSLPETPIFARGCDAPRTPHRRAPDVPGGRAAPRQSNTLGNLNTIATSNASTYRHQQQTGLEQALVGAELLRLAGGPQRGWYPKQRQPQNGRRRPASIEHLDRTGAAQRAGWAAEAGGAAGRKPLTLPPNLTPRFFNRSPREALRRVTSLLIKKGNNGKESKKDKEMVSPTIHENANGEEVHKKKGFFKSFWKRSRHYSLEQQQ